MTPIQPFPPILVIKILLHLLFNFIVLLFKSSKGKNFTFFLTHVDSFCTLDVLMKKQIMKIKYYCIDIKKINKFKHFYKVFKMVPIIF